MAARVVEMEVQMAKVTSQQQSGRPAAQGNSSRQKYLKMINGKAVGVGTGEPGALDHAEWASQEPYSGACLVARDKRAVVSILGQESVFENVFAQGATPEATLTLANLVPEDGAVTAPSKFFGAIHGDGLEVVVQETYAAQGGSGEQARGF